MTYYRALQKRNFFATEKCFYCTYHVFAGCINALKYPQNMTLQSDVMQTHQSILMWKHCAVQYNTTKVSFTHLNYLVFTAVVNALVFPFSHGVLTGLMPVASIIVS